MKVSRLQFLRSAFFYMESAISRDVVQSGKSKLLLGQIMNKDVGFYLPEVSKVDLIVKGLRETVLYRCF